MNTDAIECHPGAHTRVLLEGFDGRKSARYLLHEGDLSKPTEAKACEWKQTGVQVGRSSENDIALKSPVVSRHHAVLVANDEEVAVIDLGSSNGTFINGNRIEPGHPEPLPLGCEVSFGHGAVLVRAS